MSRIRELREALRQRYPTAFTQREVARRIGISRKEYQQWEAATHRPRRRYHARLAREFGVTIPELGLDDDQPGHEPTSHGALPEER